MAEQGIDREVLAEHNRRSRERQESYRDLQLTCSDNLFRWLAEEYEPLEYEVRKTIGEPARWGKPLPAEATELRRRYNRMLYKDLVERFRPEVAVLRDPVPAKRHLRRGWAGRQSQVESEDEVLAGRGNGVRASPVHHKDDP